MLTENLAAVEAAKEGLDTWNGNCMELVNELLREYPEADILWVEALQDWKFLPGTWWDYHAVIVLDGIVHDAWNPEQMLPPAEYVEAVFGEARWELNPGKR